MSPPQCSCTVQLHRLIHDVLRGLGREQLRHCRATGQVLLARVVSGRRGVHQQAAGFGPRRHFGQRVRHGLLLYQRAAECFARSRVLHRRVEGGLCHADRESADARPEQVQRPHGYGETAVLLAEQFVAIHSDTVEYHRADGVRAHQIQVLAAEPSAVAGDDEGADAA